MPSTRLNPTQYIREFKEIVKIWEVEVPPNSYFDHANTFRVIKDANGVTRIAIFHNNQSHLWASDFDSFCDIWVRHSTSQNVSRNSQSESSSTQTQSAKSMGMHTQGAIPSNIQKTVPSTVPRGIPSTAHKANVQTTASFQSATPRRPEYPQPSSKQSTPMSTSMPSRGNGLTHQATPSTSATQPTSTSTSMPNRGNSLTHQALSSASQATSSTSAIQPTPTSTSMPNRGNALTHQAMPSATPLASATQPTPMSTSTPKLGNASTHQAMSSASQTTPLASATQPTPMPTSTPELGNALTHQAMPSTSQTPATQPPIWTGFIPPSILKTPSSVSVSQTPSRQVSTIANDVTRSAKQADKRFLASHILFGLGKRAREPDSSSTATEPQAKRYVKQFGTSVILSANYPNGQATQAVQKRDVPLQTIPGGSSAVSDSLQQPPQHTVMISQELRQTSQASAPASSSDQQQQLVNIAPQISSEIPSTGQAVAAASTEIPDASTTFSDKTPLNLQNTSIVQGEQAVQIPIAQSDSQQENFTDDLPVTCSVLQPQSAASVPLVTSSTITQTSTRPSPVPLTPSLAVSPLPPLVVDENTAQPVATLKIPQFSVPAELPSPVSQKQPLFLPSPVSSPGLDANDDISIPGAQSENMVTRSFNQPKSSGSANRGKNRAYILVPPRPEYLVKYWQLKKQKRSRALLEKNVMASRSSVSTDAGEEGV